VAPVVIVRTDISEKRIAPIIKMERISELGTTLEIVTVGARGTVVVKALCYKAEDRGFEI
jgi:hypothetical protein